MINAILWQARTGVPWKTAHERLRKWTADGTWERLLREVQVEDDAVGAVEWTISVDSSHVRAHQHAAGARNRGSTEPAEPPRRVRRLSWTRGAVQPVSLVDRCHQ